MKLPVSCEPAGATPIENGTLFRVWVPDGRRVELELPQSADPPQPMQRTAGGMWQLTVPQCGPGTLYRYIIDGAGPFPDPASRSQPTGVHGPSQVVDTNAFHWRDAHWRGLRMPGLVVYECHVGTATREGTFASLAAQLPRLAQLGINAIELMPVATCPGKRNWGYDGVFWFAASARYGGPSGLQHFVDCAHACGIGVLLDVVYNHLGPEGNYLANFSRHYFSDSRTTPWGTSINLDGRLSGAVRRFIIDNACQWLRDFHIDGLRLDATEWLIDESPTHLLQALTTAARSCVSPHREVVLIAETHENDVRYLQPADKGGHGFDAVWVDDFYWSLRRYGTGERAGRLRDYSGSLHQVAQTINNGFLYEGEYSQVCRTPRGSRARELPAASFVYALQHHDHVGNRARGDRLHVATGLDWYRVASALLLLQPATPLLFMGQEFAASSEFLYFTDHPEALGRRVARGRRREFTADAQLSAADAAAIPDPQASETFRRSVLPLDELSRAPGRDLHSLYQALIALRRTDKVLCSQNRHCVRARAATGDVLVLYWDQRGARRLLVANFGHSGRFRLPELALADARWRVRLATNAARFGGDGVACSVSAQGLRLPARTAVFLAHGPDPA